MREITEHDVPLSVTCVTGGEIMKFDPNFVAKDKQPLAEFVRTLNADGWRVSDGGHMMCSNCFEDQASQGQQDGDTGIHEDLDE